MGFHVTLGRVLKRDWQAFGLSILVATFGLITIAGLLAVALWRPQDSEIALLGFVIWRVFLVATVLCAIFLVRRVLIVRRVFASGEIVTGQVVHVGKNTEDIGFAKITYQFGNQEYQTNSVTERATDRIQLAPGEQIELVVDPEKPSRAFVIKLFK